MTTATPTMATATDAPLLQLIWLASPALPIGGFSYSEGMESAIDAGLVTNEASVAAWLLEQLYLTQARGDLAVAAQAIEAWRAGDNNRIAQLDAWVLQTRETSELRQQSEQMGRSLVEWLKAVQPELVEGSAHATASTGSARTHYGYPVAFALAASATGATTRDCLLAFAFGWAENMVQAALKSVPLGQSSGQRVLGRLAREIPAAVDVALALHDEDRQAFSPMLAILSARHETQYSRLFRS
ncbi:MAG: urease accessory protein UreF [Ramlibacter sp.]|nr:urease accessory protein UreF [Ramlibacter sp.]